MIFCYNIIVEPLTLKLLRTIVHTTTVIEPQFLLCFKINSNPAYAMILYKNIQLRQLLLALLFPRKTFFKEEAIEGYRRSTAI